MDGPGKTRRMLHHQIAEHLKRQEQSRAELADLRARAKTLDRKLDTRRKIIVGAAVLAHAKLDSVFGMALLKAVGAAITRPQDRALFPEFFAQQPQPEPAPPARPLKPPGEPPQGAAPA